MAGPFPGPRRVLTKLRGLTGRPSANSDEVPPASARFLHPIAPLVPMDPSGPRVVLLNDCRDQVNFGAVALVDGLVAILNQSLPAATIYPIPSHWLMDLSSDAGVFVDAGRGLQQPRATFPTVADQFEGTADKWMEGSGGRGAREFLTRLRSADLVVLNGEGSIYRTNMSAVRELFLAWFAKERLGIPTVFLNGMVHLTDVVPVLPAMVRRTFPTLDAVAVREPCSFRNLQEYVPEVAAEIVPDSAFVFTAADARQTQAVREIKAQLADSPYFCFDPGPMPIDHDGRNSSTLYQLISRLLQVVPRAVLVSSGPSDTYIRDVAAETKSIFVDSITDYREYMALVADAQFIVSGRYHNPILAGIMGCPSITFASANHKVHGVCEMFDGLVGIPYDGTHLRPQLDTIEQHARSYVANRAELDDRLVEVCRRHRLGALRLGALAAKALDGRESDRRVNAWEAARP